MASEPAIAPDKLIPANPASDDRPPKLDPEPPILESTSGNNLTSDSYLLSKVSENRAPKDVKMIVTNSMVIYTLIWRSISRQN